MKNLLLLMILLCQYDTIVGQSFKDVEVTIVNDELYFNNMPAPRVVYGQKLVGYDLLKVCEQYFEDGYQQEVLNTLSALWWIGVASKRNDKQGSYNSSLFSTLLSKMHPSSELYDLIENPKWLILYDDFFMDIKRETEKRGLEYNDTITIELSQVYCVIGETKVLMPRDQYYDGVTEELTYQILEQDLEARKLFETKLTGIWKESLLYYQLSEMVNR